MQLPPEGKYLVIVKFFETVGNSSLSYTSPTYFVTQAFFDPHRGWELRFVPDLSKVLFWKPLQELPDEM